MQSNTLAGGIPVSARVQPIGDALAAFGTDEETSRVNRPLGKGEPPLPSQARPDVLLEFHADLVPVAKIWRDFEKTALCSGFQAFDWVGKVHQHVGTKRGDHPAVVFGKDKSGGLLFILPLCVTKGAVRRLSWLGSELCDYNGPLLARSFAQTLHDNFAGLWRDVLALIQAGGLSFDVVDLSKNPDLIADVPNPFRVLSDYPNPSGAYVATLGLPWEAFYASKRSKTTRKREFRKEEKLAEYGAVSFAEAQESEDIIRTVETLFAQKSRAFARMGVDNMFDRPGYREFYRDVASDPATKGFIRVSRLDVGAETGGTNLGLHFQGSYYNVLSSYFDGDMSRFGPGSALLHRLIQRAISDGCHSFDFTIGDEGYKTVWADRKLTLYDHLEAASMKGWLVVRAVVLLRQIKRTIKQTPILWKAYTTLRTLKGKLSRTQTPAHEQGD